MLFSRINIGVNYSIVAADDLRAIAALGYDAFQTVMMDIHCYDDFPLLALVATLANTRRLKHLFLTAITGDSTNLLPIVEENDNQAEEWLNEYGRMLVAATKHIEDIHIDFVGEPTIAPFKPMIANFIQLAWMYRPKKSDSALTAIIKRFLFHVRPTIALNAIYDSQVYSNRDLEDNF